MHDRRTSDHESKGVVYYISGDFVLYCIVLMIVAIVIRPNKSKHALENI